MPIHNLKIPLKFVCFIFIVLSLSHCSQRKKIDIDSTVRDPAAENDSLIQVAPMVPEAVNTLIHEADAHLKQGQISSALLSLKRALSIAPSSALVQQHLAEVYLSDADYKQAMYWSTLVVNLGPDQGGLCERSRRTQALAAEMLGAVDIQAQALDAIAQCTTEAAAKY